MNKYKKLCITFSSLILAFSAQSSCEYKEQLIQQIDVASSNIANSTTTRTPSGGPYKKKSIYCSDSGCVISSSSDFISIYEPNHVDADANGIVLFPNINTLEEMDNMIRLQELYEWTLESCPADLKL